MADLNEEIRKLKEEGLSLRAIANSLGISHEGVRKRLKAVKDKDQVSTGSKPCKSRASEELGDTVNLRQTSTDTGESVNPSGNHSRGPLWGMKEVFQGVDSESGDLFEGIKDFLEAKGVEVYRINVEPEGYQVKNNGQTIRIYVQRKMEEPKSKGER